MVEGRRAASAGCRASPAAADGAPGPLPADPCTAAAINRTAGGGASLPHNRGADPRDREAEVVGKPATHASRPAPPERAAALRRLAARGDQRPLVSRGTEDQGS